MSLLQKISPKPWFPLLLPIFFVFHGFQENAGFIQVRDALLLTGIYLGFTLLFWAAGWLLFRNRSKAALLAAALMAFHFFFGSFQDLLKQVFPGSFINRYSVILPFFALCFLLLMIALRRKIKDLTGFSRFANALLLLLILLDAVMYASKIIPGKKQPAIPEGFTACTGCEKPDIWFILADEYAGNTELIDQFQFNDSVFLNELAGRHFRVIPESHSNYNYTPFSMASILNMDYLSLQNKDRGQSALTYCYNTIRENRFVKYLQSQGYQFYNYSVFDFEGQPARVLETFLPASTRLITAQTFLSRAEKDLGFNLVTRFKSRAQIERYTYATLHNNENIMQLTRQLAETETNSPKLVYTHLMLPHYPYYYDASGKPVPFESLQEGKQVNRQLYVQYLQYSNKQLLNLTDAILKNAKKPPLIILMGDHGFRHFNAPVEQKYYFLNLMSIHDSAATDSLYPAGMPAVNMLRTLLNSHFHQHLPLLSDSLIYLKD